MFWNIHRASKTPAYMNTWYEASLKNLAKKISQTIKDDKTYSNIPFGKSLIDVYSDGENAIIAVKTVVDKRMMIEEQHTTKPYIHGYLHPFKIKRHWKNCDDKAPFTKESAKQICVSIAQLILDSDLKEDVWVFPYFNYLIVVEIDETRKSHGKKYVSGSASIRSFDGEYGCSGSFGGTFLEEDEILTSSERKRHVKADHSLYQTLFGSKLGESIVSAKDYDAINSADVSR